MLAHPSAMGRFRRAAIAWSAARASVHPCDPAMVAMRSWARRTTQRHHGALFQLGNFDEGCTVPAWTAACSSQFSAVKVADGAARCSLRNINSVVLGAEDLRLLPPTMAPVHWRLSKGGQPSGSQLYFSPRAMGHLCRAASTKEEGHRRAPPSVIPYSCGSRRHLQSAAAIYRSREWRHSYPLRWVVLLWFGAIWIARRTVGLAIFCLCSIKMMMFTSHLLPKGRLVWKMFSSARSRFPLAWPALACLATWRGCRKLSPQG